MRLSILGIFFFLIGFSGLGQSFEKSLIDSAINYSGKLFVNSEPTIKLNIDAKELWRHYPSWYESLKKLGIDTTLLFQFIDNRKNIDTTTWTDGELSNVLVINNPAAQINLKSAIQKLRPATKKQTRSYTKRIKQYNALLPFSDSYSFSKPVYDNSREYAIVQSETTGWGSGRITIYHLSGGIWRTFGVLTEWIN